MENQNAPQGSDSIQLNGVEYTHQEIFNVVDDFYTRIQNDPLLQVPFSSVHDWPEHIKNLTHFWWIRFGGKLYLEVDYNPVAKHFFAGFTRELLARWLFLFRETLQSHLQPKQVQLWAMITERMGDSLAMRNDMLKSQHS